ncbi:MAG: carboxyl transferase domain-containing protein, partial [Bacteroidota bacterium]
VPLITIVTGGSYGAGNYAMVGRAFDPRFLFMWPQSKIGVMGGDQAAMVLTQIKKSKTKKTGDNGNAKDNLSEEQLFQQIKKKYDEQSSAIYSTSRIWDDGIIDPAHTRKILSIVLEVVTNRQWPEFKPGIYRM